MTRDEFRRIDIEYRKLKPNLFELSNPDKPANAESLSEVETLIGAELSGSYRAFLEEFGGGEFGLSVIFSADSSSELYLPRKVLEIGKYLPERLLPFSDDFAGGLYALEIIDGKAQEAVFYWNQDGGRVTTGFRDLFEFVARYAYEPA